MESRVAALKEENSELQAHVLTIMERKSEVRARVMPLHNALSVERSWRWLLVIYLRVVKSLRNRSEIALLSL
jgi:hypothetical protein